VEEPADGIGVFFPGFPDFFFLEVNAEEAEAFVEVGEPAFFGMEFEAKSGKDLSREGEELLGLFGGFGEDDEVIGITDEAAAGVEEADIEFLEEEVGEEW